MRESGPFRSTPRRATTARTRVALLVLVLGASACGVGTWSLNPTDAPVRAVHAALLENGNVLLIQGSGNDRSLFAAGTFTSTEWDPVENTFRSIPTPYDMFCAGHAALPDGGLLVAGGTTGYPSAADSLAYEGSDRAYRFDVASHSYIAVPDLEAGHWYPTLVARGDGTVVMVGGLDENGILRSTTQTFDPAGDEGRGTWTPGRQTASFFPMYPALHLLADGRFFYSGVSTFGDGNNDAGIWDATANTFASVPGLPDRDRRDMGASVLLPPAQSQKLMVMGGGSHTNRSAKATASTGIIDLSQSAPAYVEGPPLSEGKQYLSAVVLPDRTVLQTGGTNQTYLTNDRPDFEYRYSAQIFHPDSGVLELAARSTVGRTYHSEALLLPDGRVATFGGNASDIGSPFEMRIEIYAPKYTKRVRPALTVDPAARSITRGGTTSFTTDRPLKWVHLVRPGAATHSNDPDQRLVDLPFTQTAQTDGAGGAVAASLDANPNLTPPGWYMLFGVDTDGTPSVATWVKVT